MGKNIFIALLFVIIIIPTKAQFPPSAGKLGSTAIPWDSSCFVGWGIQATTSLGLRDLSQPDSGYADVGNEESALGKARTNGVFSLGDSGSITFYFANPIVNKPGFDFAVFENAFNDSFLELAHVEISADGVSFYRIPSESLTQTKVQTGAFGATQATQIHNLAGKYRMPYGTPFDISDLDTNQEFFPNEFYWIRLRDVVGSINPRYGTRDSKGRIINDPWPTRFASSGFDVDAIGIIHQLDKTNGLQVHRSSEQLYWYIKNDRINIYSKTALNGYTIINAFGQIVISSSPKKNENEIVLPKLKSGNYVFISTAGRFTFCSPY